MKGVSRGTLTALLAEARSRAEERHKKIFRPRLNGNEVSTLYRLLDKEIREDANWISWTEKNEPDDPYLPDKVQRHKEMLRLRRKLGKLL